MTTIRLMYDKKRYAARVFLGPDPEHLQFSGRLVLTPKELDDIGSALSKDNAISYLGTVDEPSPHTERPRRLGAPK